MEDLINRQAAIKAICEDSTWLESQGCTDIWMAERKQRDVDILSGLPSIDAVQVVRCKDCIHSTSQVSDDEDNYYCNAMMRCMHSLEYCSHGERKES